MLSIWRFTDGKRGHDNQSLGLAEALCRMRPCKVETIAISKGWPYLFHWLLAQFPDGRNLPPPDLIVGAGHATHWPMLAARRFRGGRIAVVMKPSLPLSWFDRVIAPAHDFPRSIPPNAPSSRGDGISLSKQESAPSPFLVNGQSDHGEPWMPPSMKGVANASDPGDFPSRNTGRLWLTLGPLNRVKPGHDKDPKLGLLLIGGPSAEYGWSETALLKQIHLIALHQPEVTWHLTTSRRTPSGLLADLGRLGVPNIQAVAHGEVDADWLPHHLAQASQVWVTPDSASMVYEALTSGAAVGCLELPFLKPGRVARGLERLVRENRLTAFADWQATGKLKPNIHPLNEAERCAKAILQWLEKD
jgi:uncharacterized protein